MLVRIKRLGLFSGLIFLLSHSTSALEPEATYGNRKLVNSNLSEILHHGRLDLDKMQITSETRVNGTLNAENSTLQNITINGRGNIKNSTVLGNIRTNGMLNLEKVKISGFVEVSGYVQTDKATIEGEMIISSDKIEIKDSTIFRIRIRPTLNKLAEEQSKQLLILSNTKVLGNVIFEGDNGEIIQDKSSILGSIEGIQTQKKK
jgi:cytoskeletal protein CcmA (bactofilin family)